MGTDGKPIINPNYETELAQKEAEAIIAAEQAALAQESATEVNNVLANSANTDFSNITDNAKTVIKENGGVWGFIQGDISVQTDLSETFETKADVDLSNCTKPYITETYCSGASWYRIWSDGWIEQGGRKAVNTNSVNNYNYSATALTFLTPFKVGLENLKCNAAHNCFIAGANMGINDRPTTSVILYQKNTQPGAFVNNFVFWYANGY